MYIADQDEYWGPCSHCGFGVTAHLGPLLRCDNGGKDFFLPTDEDRRHLWQRGVPRCECGAMKCGSRVHSDWCAASGRQK